MGRRGPPPKPTAVRLLLGDRKDRINTSEPIPAAVPVEAPDWLPSDARQVWDSLADDLVRRSVLTLWDVQGFAAYCDAAARRRRAVEHLEAEGEVLTLPVMDHNRVVGTRVSRNPWALILAEADGEMLRYSARFGLTPSDRSQLKTDPIVNGPGADLLSG